MIGSPEVSPKQESRKDQIARVLWEAQSLIRRLNAQSASEEIIIEQVKTLIETQTPYLAVHVDEHGISISMGDHELTGRVYPQPDVSKQLLSYRAVHFA